MSATARDGTARVDEDVEKLVELSVERVLAAGSDEVFEDGMESSFSRALVALIAEHGDGAIQALHDAILQGRVNAEAAGEALRWVGQIEDPGTVEKRRLLLEGCLACVSPTVRDGASLGLAFVDDPRSVAALRAAVDREPVPTGFSSIC